MIVGLLIKTRRTGCVGHVARMGAMINVYTTKVYSESLERRDLLENVEIA
jgi:hypothetical protein